MGRHLLAFTRFPLLEDSVGFEEAGAVGGDILAEADGDGLEQGRPTLQYNAYGLWRVSASLHDVRMTGEGCEDPALPEVLRLIASGWRKKENHGCADGDFEAGEKAQQHIYGKLGVKGRVNRPRTARVGPDIGQRSGASPKILA